MGRRRDGQRTDRLRPPARRRRTDAVRSARRDAVRGVGDMIELVAREFTVDVPLDRAWDHLSRVEQWPSWARHIKRVALEPPGMLTEGSSGAFRFAGGARS